MGSAGQKVRLSLAAMFWTKPHLIAVDEPTNYLDVETVEALAKALSTFRGGIVMIEPKTDFVERICNEKWHSNCREAKECRQARSMRPVPHRRSVLLLGSTAAGDFSHQRWDTFRAPLYGERASRIMVICTGIPFEKQARFREPRHSSQNV